MVDWYNCELYEIKYWPENIVTRLDQKPKMLSSPAGVIRYLLKLLDYSILQTLDVDYLVKSRIQVFREI